MVTTGLRYFWTTGTQRLSTNKKLFNNYLNKFQSDPIYSYLLQFLYKVSEEFMQRHYKEFIYSEAKFKGFEPQLKLKQNMVCST